MAEDNTRIDRSVTSETDRRLDALRDLFPEAFVDGALDVSALSAVAAPDASVETGRYGLSWAGKGAAQAALQVGSVATLQPDRARSRQYDEARNLMVEGDNLEVLRLMQRAYNDRIRLIVIDPPYNTGNDFIYDDDFRDGLGTYLRFTGQVDAKGKRTTSNSETGGRYHSNWLSMMYPRLALARNLLRQDGAIFVCIDDHEVHNLRLLMDEVFGPENFVACNIWQKVYSPKNSARHFSVDHDYVVVYARDKEQWSPGLLPRTAEQDAAYTNPDNDPRGAWKAGDFSARNYYGAGTYAIETPSGRIIEGPPTGNYWRYSKERLRELDADNRIWWGADGSGTPAIKRFRTEVKQGRVPQTIWPYEEVGHNQDAKKHLHRRVAFATSDSVFDTPKPVRLVRRMLTLGTASDRDDIVLDFFAGSGTTADAVMEANAEDGGDRRFIVIQAPEPTGYDDYPTVSDITLARLESAAEEFDRGEGSDKCLPGAFGYRTLALAPSNFRVWDPEAASSDASELGEQLAAFTDTLRDDANDDGIVIEILLKDGITPDQPLRMVNIAGVSTTIVGEADVAIALTDSVTDGLIDGLIELAPRRVVIREAAFTGIDSVKTNAALRFEEAGIVFRTA